MAFRHVVEVADAEGKKLGLHEKKCLKCKSGKLCGAWTRMFNKAQKEANKAWRIK